MHPSLEDIWAAAPALGAMAVVLVAACGACVGVLVSRLARRIAAGESPLCDRRHRVQRGYAAVPFASASDKQSFSETHRHRGRRISVRQVIAALLCALYFVSVVCVYGFSVEGLALCAFGCALLGLSLVDLDTFTIPNGFVLAGAIIWAACVWFFPLPTEGWGLGALFVPVAGLSRAAVLLDGVVGACVPAGFLLISVLGFDALTGRASLGGGDVKVVFVSGLFLGVAGNVLSLMVACFVGLVFAAAFRRANARREGLSRLPGEAPAGSTAFPFGPSLALATWFALIAGPGLLAVYFGLG